MNIQPSAGVVGAAGTALAQTRGDTQTNQSLQSSMNRQQAPGQAEGADSLTLNESEKAGDRDGDGRMLNSPDHHEDENEASSEKAGDEASLRSGPVVTEGLGEQLDLDA